MGTPSISWKINKTHKNKEWDVKKNFIALFCVVISENFVKKDFLEMNWTSRFRELF